MHREAGREMAQLGIDVVWGVRGLARELVAGAIEAGLPSAQFFEASDKAGAALADEIRAGDLVLVKGSRSVETDRVVAAVRERFALVMVGD
jgi:UDP-N-acetylmuramoyl-tripeptide--D-alanyl-D-alanine ligase